MSELPPLGLYIHFPWCVAKCPYCDFNSHTLRGELPAAAYIDALINDLSFAATALQGRVVSSLFLGGGTPSLFPPHEISRLLTAVEARLNVAPDAEITMEANPGALEHGAFAGYRQAGINRLSLGAQSFDDRKLQRLGRIHDSAAVWQAFAAARAAGFDNINLDMMFALPEQNIDEALADVAAAIELSPEHISYYHLTLEPNTVFYSRPPQLPDGDMAWQMHDSASALLTAAGYSNYEVSAWARPGQECRHNVNYWEFGDYVGLGAGAHGKVTADSGAINREVRVAHPREYLRQISAGGAVSRAIVDAEALLFEFMLNGLRLKNGFALQLFAERTGLATARLQPLLDKAKQKQLLEESEPGRWRATENGWRFLNDLQTLFLPED